MARMFTCDACKETFEIDDDWTEDDANQEALDTWGVKDATTNENMMRICGDCYEGVRVVLN